MTAESVPHITLDANLNSFEGLNDPLELPALFLHDLLRILMGWLTIVLAELEGVVLIYKNFHNQFSEVVIVTLVFYMLYRIGLFCHKLWEKFVAKFSSYFGDFSVKAFDGDASIPLCAHCTPILRQSEIVVGGRDYEKVFMVPNSCARCSRYPCLDGMVPRVLYATKDLIQPLMLYSTFQLERPRSVHSTMQSVIDTTPQFSHEHVFLEQCIGRLCTMEHQDDVHFFFPLLRKWNKHTDSYRLATGWRSVTNWVTPQASESPAQSMRRYWNFVSVHAGNLPVITSISSRFAVLRTMVRNIPAHFEFSRHSRMTEDLERGRDGIEQIPERHWPLLGGRREDGADRVTEDIGFTSGPRAVAVGPIITPTQVHDTSDPLHVATGVETRILPEVDEDTGEPLHFQPESATGKRFLRFWSQNKLKNFTPRRIEESYNMLFGKYKSFSEITLSKFSKEQIAEMVTGMEMTTEPEGLPTRSANGKLETVEKDKLKPVRLTYDNKLELLGASYVFTKIYQDLHYGAERGIFHSYSIKEKDREKAVAELVLKMSKTKTDVCGFEIDQTGMERHERASKGKMGMLTPSYSILQKICTTLRGKFHAKFSTLYESKLLYDLDKGMVFNLKTKDKRGRKNVKVSVGDMYLDSGWSLTSGINFANELSGVLASAFLNPDHVFAWNTEAQKFHLQCPTNKHQSQMGVKCPNAYLCVETSFDDTFNTVPLFESDEPDSSHWMKQSSIKSPFVVKIEGDDGAGQLAARFAYARNKAIFEANQRELGFCAKLVIVTSGRLEFIGVHFGVVGGKPISNNPDTAWIPNIKRSIGKIGTKVGNDNGPAATVARFCSLASMFAGRSNAMYDIFMNSALRVLDENPAVKQATITVNEYDDLWKTQGLAVGKHAMSGIIAHAEEQGMRTFPTVKNQLRLFNTSIFCNPDSVAFSNADHGRLEHVATRLRSDGFEHSEEIWHLMPDSLKGG
jgi:hypothetical protein